MFFPDITCTVQESMQINSNIGVYDLVTADFVLVLTAIKPPKHL